MNESPKPQFYQTPRLPQLLGSATVGTLFAAATWSLTQIGLPLFEEVKNKVSPQLLLHTIVILGFCLLCSLSWILSLRRELKSPKSSQFDFNEFGGYYIDRRNKFAVCTRCLNASSPKVVHMMDAGDGLRCFSCNQDYPKDVRK